VVIISTVFSSVMIVPVAIISPVLEPFMFEPVMVKPSVVEVSSMIPFEIRTIVFIVDAVAEVAVPNGVVVISTPGEIIFIYDARRCRCIFILVYRSGFLVDYGRRCDVHPADRNTKTDVGIYKYLGVGRAGEKGAGDDRGKDK
jgi:hypothetical protein